MPSGPFVVIGGGVAGIACACSLADRGARVILIERGVRLGGRAGSFMHPAYGLVDFGQHVLMRCCTESIALLGRLGAEGAIRFQSRLDVPIATHDSPQPARARVTSAWLPPPLHLVPSLLRYRLLSRADRVRVLPAALSLWLHAPETGMTFETWLRRRTQSAQAITRFWEPISIAALNAPVAAVDVGAAGKVFRDAFLAPHGADLGFFRRPLSDLFGAAVPYIEQRQGTVLLGTRVRSIAIRDGRCLGVELVSGGLIRTQAVVSAVPPLDLAALLPVAAEADLGLPGSDAARNLRWAPIVNMHLWFDRSVMRSDMPFFIAVDGPVQAVFNVSAFHRGATDHHLVVSQSAANDLARLPDADILDTLLGPLMHLLPAAAAARLLGSFVSRWRDATFVSEPGADAFRPESCSGIDRLLLAGDWTRTGWPSTIEGAIRSGLEAAESIS